MNKPILERVTLQDGESANLVNENIKQLKAIFPDAFSEGGLNFDTLRQLMGDVSAIDESEEKYGLNWHGKKKARQVALTPSTGTLLPCPGESVDWDKTQNLFVEGDNLEVLKLLQKSYAGKVKMIYIDPPYNTGKEFVYPDNFQDNLETYLKYTGQIDDEGMKFSSNTESSGRYHTNWLNMIYPRIHLAKNLLTADGVILVSIDEHEVVNLRQLMNEVFGEENFISCLAWEKGRKNDAKFFSNGHEYVVIYARSQSYLREIKAMWREEKPGARDIWEKYLSLRKTHGENDSLIEVDLQDWYSSLPKSHPAKKWSRYKHIDKNGPWRDDNISWPGGGGPRYDVIHPKTKMPCAVPERGWVFSKPETMQQMIDLGIVEFREDHSAPPIRKSHIRPVNFELLSACEANEDESGDDSDNESEEDLATQVRGSYFYKQSQVSVKYLRNLFGKKVFNNPKDVDEISRLVRYTTSDDPNAIIMDFFAGSGTTGEAVMRLNSEDEGARRFILVQLPEPLDPSSKEQKVAAKFCEENNIPRNIAALSRERLRRAAKQINAQGEDKKIDTGFKVFSLASSSIKAWRPDRNDLEETLLSHQEHLVAGRSEEDVLYELLIKRGIDLGAPIQSKVVSGKSIYSIGYGVLFACLDETIDGEEVESIAQGILSWHHELAPASDSHVFFRDSAFSDDVSKTNMAAILEQNGITHVRSL